LKFYIGYDLSRSHVFDYCIKSISKYKIYYYKIGSSVLNENVWYRKKTDTDSTEFSVCRFLAPYLSDYEGWSVFMDDDFYWKVSPFELEQFCDDSYSVLVCKHNYVPKKNIKWGNLNQLKYNKKNWSSLMLFNNSHPDCKKLDIKYVNESMALDLHQFKWTDNVGSIPLEYNFLVGEYENEKNAKALHYTNGFPEDLCIE
tara:strand:+ start:1218 stop:1817 length:600 start_codon:yes stop_codon:yes gene_type:complete